LYYHRKDDVVANGTPLPGLHTPPRKKKHAVDFTEKKKTEPKFCVLEGAGKGEREKGEGKGKRE
jgi:hypothetical protein